MARLFRFCVLASMTAAFVPPLGMAQVRNSNRTLFGNQTNRNAFGQSGSDAANSEDPSAAGTQDSSDAGAPRRGRLPVGPYSPQNFGPRLNQAGGFSAQQSPGGLLGAGLSRAGQRGFGRRGRRGENGQLGSGGRAASIIVYRSTRSIGFAYPKPARSAVRSRLEARLASKNIRATGRLGVSVIYDGPDRKSIALLRGNVATHEDRVVAGLVALLEPGISEVRNELTVSPALELPIPPQKED